MNLFHINSFPNAQCVRFCDSWRFHRGLIETPYKFTVIVLMWDNFTLGPLLFIVILLAELMSFIGIVRVGIIPQPLTCLSPASYQRPTQRPQQHTRGSTKSTAQCYWALVVPRSYNMCCPCSADPRDLSEHRLDFNHTLVIYLIGYTYRLMWS